jgi:hypothetical protein
MIQFVPNTERVRQIRFYQLIQMLRKEGPGWCIAFDEEGLEAAYPGFLHTFDFTGIDVKRLYDFITVEYRHLPESSFSEFAAAQEFMCFEDEQFSEADALDACPVLFDFIEVSEETGWIVVTQFWLTEVWTLDRVPTGVRSSPSYIDNGELFFIPLSPEYVAYEEEDNNNGTRQLLYRWLDGKLIQTPINSQEVIDLMMDCGMNVEVRALSDDLASDDATVVKILEHHGLEFAYLTEEAQRQEDFIAAAIRYWPSMFKYVPDDLRADRDLVSRMLEVNGGILPYAAPELLQDRAMALAAAGSSVEVFHQLPPEFQQDPEFIRVQNSVKKNAADEWDEAGFF